MGTLSVVKALAEPCLGPWRVAGKGKGNRMRKSVLIVEDESLIRSLCADVFRDAAYTVLEAEDGDQALELLRSGIQVTAIVSDIRMPGAIDGLALRREVERQWPGIKMVLTSGHMHVERSELSKDQAFIPKPYRFLDLVRQVEQLITD